MSRYKAYPEYKDSGVEWIGNIPDHWECVRLKFAAELSGRKVEPNDKEKYVGLENVQSNNGKYIATEDVTPEGISNSFSCGDVLFGKLRPYLAKSWLADFSGICSSEFLVLTSKKVDARFLNYFTLTEEFIKQVDSSTYGSKMPRANWDFVGLLDVPVPPNESKQIAAFLDHETAKIDALIEKQQRLIELLKEKRQAVISHAVTRGLNPNAPLKDSGVEWLGEVPAHWVVTRAKFLFDFVTSGSRGWAEYYSDDGDLFFRIANLTRDTILPKLESIQNVSPPSGSEGERSRIKLNDILISITADLGSVCVANAEIENGYVSQHVALCRPNTCVASPDWLGFYVLSDVAKEQLIGSGYGGTKVQLSLEDIRELVVLLPAESEQTEIAKYIKERMACFSKLEEIAYSQIDYLQERRTALISAAVTGKIDVRDWQAPA